MNVEALILACDIPPLNLCSNLNKIYDRVPRQSSLGKKERQAMEVNVVPSPRQDKIQSVITLWTLQFTLLKQYKCSLVINLKSFLVLENHPTLIFLILGRSLRHDQEILFDLLTY